MCRGRWFLIVFVIVSALLATTTLAQNELTEHNYEMDPYQNQQNRGSWMHSAREAIAGPAGQFVVHMAKEMISRQAGNSQVSIIK